MHDFTLMRTHGDVKPSELHPLGGLNNAGGGNFTKCLPHGVRTSHCVFCALQHNPYALRMPRCTLHNWRSTHCTGTPRMIPAQKRRGAAMRFHNRANCHVQGTVGIEPPIQGNVAVVALLRLKRILMESIGRRHGGHLVNGWRLVDRIVGSHPAKRTVTASVKR